MATKAAHKRLTKEYATISQNPPPYIVAHPSESNILEWHYVLTGPPDTPYDGGQYWGTLVFPSDYPFSPPAIRMHTPSGRFRCNERLCLSISDFHPKKFNPAWEVSTILLGVLSFMTSEEMTTGSISASPGERKRFAALTRWENSTGHGTSTRTLAGTLPAQAPSSNTRGFGAILKNTGGQAFREQWPELDEENWKWMEKNHIDPQTGHSLIRPLGVSSGVESDGIRQRASTATAAVGANSAAHAHAEPSWVRKNAMYLGIGALFTYVIVARLLGQS